MIDFSAFIHLVPEPWRTYALAALFAFLASQMVASLIVALLPAAAFAHPVLGRYARALATFGHFKPSDAPGTLKAPLSALDARSLDELARVAAQGQRIVDAITPSKVPPSIPPQGGFARPGAVALLLAVALCLAGLGAVLTGCREPSNCNRQVDAWRCSPEGRPERCSEGNVWRSYAYGPCSMTREVCVSVPGAAFCRPPQDASLPPNPFTDASAPQE